MLSKISNTALKKNIELELNSKFDYGYLYAPMQILDGLKETSLCMVTSNALGRIQYGIWGILPTGYKDSWKSFQSMYNTLEVECESVTETSWLFDALKNRRCLIVATGFFTSEIENHRLQTTHNTLKNHHLFCFGGIYNVLEDGFLTCSILTHANGSSPYHLKNPKPLIIAKDHYNTFLESHHSIDKLCDLNYEMEIDEEQFEHHPILRLKKRPHLKKT